MNKSKFKTFILSIIPGLGHIYVGAPARGFLLMFSFFCYLFIGFSLDGYDYYGYGIYNRSNYIGIILFASLLLWLYCQYDAQRIRKLMMEGNIENYDELSKEENKNTLAMVLSVVPGAGHIYIGAREKGFKLLTIFLASYLLNTILPFQFLSLFMALIVAYGLVSLYDIINGEKALKQEELNISDYLKIFKGNYMTYLGAFLILAGILIIGNRVAMEFIDTDLLREIYSNLKEGIAALVLIIAGVKLITSNKLRKKVE